MIREINRASGILSSTAWSSGVLVWASMASSLDAWGTVRGNPSRMNLQPEGRVSDSSRKYLAATKWARQEGRIDSPVLALRVGRELLLDHADHDFVADEISAVHDLLGLFTQIGLSRDLRSEHVASGQVADTVL